MVDRKLLSLLEGLRICSRRKQRSTVRGERSSLRKGAGTEFSDFRAYLQGDDIRRIDWSLYARTEKLFLKLFLQEESRPVSLIVDASESMNFGEPTKFRYALRLAACLSYISLRRYDPARILIARNRDFEKIAIDSQKQFFPAMEACRAIATSGETFLSTVIRKIALAQSTRGTVFVVSDFYSADGLDALKLLALRHDIHCLHLLTPEECSPSLRGDLRLVDAENRSPSNVSMSAEVHKRYLRRLEEFRAEVKTVCRRSMSSYIPLVTSKPLQDVLLKDLKAAGIVM